MLKDNIQILEKIWLATNGQWKLGGRVNADNWGAANGHSSTKTQILVGDGHILTFLLDQETSIIAEQYIASMYFLHN